MEIIYSSIFQTISLDTKESLIKVVHSEYSFEMSDEDYKNYILAYITFIRKYHPKHFLINDKKLFFTVYPELQDWVNELFESIYPLITGNYLALVRSEDFYVRVSVEQLLEDTKCPLHRAYFDREDEAHQWLMSKAIPQVSVQ